MIKVWQNTIFNKKNLSSLSPQKNYKKWLSLTKSRIKNNYKEIKNNNFSEHSISSPLLLIALLQFKNKRIRVLDIGSGDLKSYFSFFKYKRFFKKIIFHSIELSKIIQMYKNFNFLNKNNKISFIASENIKKFKYDIVHMSDSLHYISDWKAYLKEIIIMSPKYIIINGTRAGKIKTFASFQNYYKAKVPTWFFSEKEILSLFKKKYVLLYNEEFINKILGNFTKLPMENFPKKSRIENSKTFIFMIRG